MINRQNQEKNLTLKNSIDKNPLVSIAVINYNGVKFLGEILDNCILSILNNDYDNFEVLFMDNGSSDNSIEYIQEKYGYDKRLKVVPLNQNLGTSGAKNVSIKISKGKYVFLLNTDIILPKYTLRKMVDVFENNPDIGILSGKLEYPDGETQSEGELFNIKESLMFALSPSLQLKVNRSNVTRQRVGNLTYVDYVIGAALMTRKDILNKLGSYDDAYFMYSEEVDLAYRVKKAGYKVACLNSLTVIHHENKTASNFSKWKLELLSRNHLLFIFKNYSSHQLAKALSTYFLRIFAHFFKSLILREKYEWETALSYLRAFDYIKKPARLPS
jgi:GT2 family glycosyltransferase